MNKKSITAVVVFVVLIALGFVLARGGDGENNTKNATSAINGEEIVIYKSPTCGCCEVYATYMKREGYHVTIKDTEGLSDIKHALGIPHDLESCHTTEVGDYVVEGHIPNEVIEKLLTLKPDIKGIGMPGMPSGSPGMPGPKVGDFVIYEITHEGTKGDVFMTI